MLLGLDLIENNVVKINIAEVVYLRHNSHIKR